MCLKDPNPAFFQTNSRMKRTKLILPKLVGSRAVYSYQSYINTTKTNMGPLKTGLSSFRFRIVVSGLLHVKPCWENR
jgi:hypothetical protein